MYSCSGAENEARPSEIGLFYEWIWLLWCWSLEIVDTRTKKKEKKRQTRLWGFGGRVNVALLSLNKALVSDFCFSVSLQRSVCHPPAAALSIPPDTGGPEEEETTVATECAVVLFYSEH